MRNKRITRRRLLQGAGGFTLALPFLPSLERTAIGQDVEFVSPKRFLSITTNHGGVYESSMFPDESMLSQSEELYPGHEISQGALTREVQGDRAMLSEVLSAPADLLTDAIVSKLNVLRGLDIPFYIAHHTGGHLGNFARNDGNGDQGMGLDAMPTIDQLMAWSPSFYPDLSQVRHRSMSTGSNGRMSYNWSNPADRSGTIEEVRQVTDPVELFRDLFTPEDPMDEPEIVRPPVVDRVFEHYRSLRDGDRRISSIDRQRLNDHMDRLAELQRRLAAGPVQRTATCEGFTAPTRPDNDYRAEMRMCADVIAVGFLCGTSRIAVMGLHEDSYEAPVPDWHQEVAHLWDTPEAQVKLVSANQAVFEQVFLYLAARLDVEDAPGHTVLDDTLMVWSQESGESTHNSRSIPVITAGGAGGAMNTGLYADYRNRTEAGIVSYWDDALGYGGLLYNQWLATALQAMGLGPDEWQDVPSNGQTGYGFPQYAEEYTRAQVSGVIERASEWLPFLEA